jgi:hypothetical protein
LEAAVEVIFSISGPTIAPQEISKLLEIEPTEATQPGLTRSTDLDGTEVETEQRGTWVLATGTRVDSVAVDDHVAYVLDLLRPHASALRELSKEAELEFYVHLPAGTPAPYRRYREFESAVRALSAGIDFDAAASGVVLPDT